MPFHAPLPLECLQSELDEVWDPLSGVTPQAAPGSSSSCSGCLRNSEPDGCLQLCPPSTLPASSSWELPTFPGWPLPGGKVGMYLSSPVTAKETACPGCREPLLLPSASPPHPVPLLSFPWLPGYWSHITQPFFSSFKVVIYWSAFGTWWNASF